MNTHDKALALILAKQPRVTISGQAGSGKTLLSSQLYKTACELGIRCGAVAYTGQAAAMLRARGIANACTIHSLIYLPQAEREAEKRATLEKLDEPDVSEAEKRRLRNRLVELREPGFVLREKADVPQLLFVDEAAMLDSEIGRDLESFGGQLVIVGDPYQLEPIEGEPYFDLSSPDIELTEVFRTDRPEILELATATRKQERFACELAKPFFERIAPSGKLWLSADRVICCSNNMRRRINREASEAAGFGARPCGKEGEKLICLRNHKELGLFNGSAVKLRNVTWNARNGRAEILRLEADGWKECGELPIYDGHFRVTERGLNKAAADRWLAEDLARNRCSGIELDWSFATTCHKAQGSEFNRVIVVRERCQKNWKWDYTAITRARTRLLILEGV